MSRFMFGQWVLTFLCLLCSLGLSVIAVMAPMPLWGFMPTLVSACIFMAIFVSMVKGNLEDRRRGW